MIHVDPAPEPEDFDRKVRRPGLRAVAELVGEIGSPKRPGRPRAKVADVRKDIPASKFPDFWTEALDDMLTLYKRICSYSCFYIEEVTGASSVDHMIPKSVAWDHVYEWGNYRLACSLMNGLKSDAIGVLDPFQVETGWFELELVGFQLKPNADLGPLVRERVARTIHRLRLNDQKCRDLRESYAAAYLQSHISYGYLSRRAPFVALELRRQGRLRAEDRTP